jgi:hypothetical protein
VVLAQKSSNPLRQFVLDLHRYRVPTVETEIDPVLQIPWPNDDFLAHLVGLDIDESTHRLEVGPAQVPARELRVPGIAPVEVEALKRRQIAEIVDRYTAVIDDESDTGAGARRPEFQLLGATNQPVFEPGEYDDFLLALIGRKGFTGNFVAPNPRARPDFHDLPLESAAIVSDDREVVLEEQRDPLLQRVRRIPHPFIDLIRQKITENR